MRKKEKIPNKETIKTLEDSEKGKNLKSFDTIEELIRDLKE